VLAKLFTNEDNMDIQYFIEGGAVGLTFFAIYCMWKSNQRLMKITSNHLDHNTSALTKLENAIHQLIGFLKDK